VQIDISDMSCSCTDLALEVMHKALSDPPDSSLLWAPHPDPLINQIIEEFSGAGTGALRNLFDALVSLVRQLAVIRKAHSFGPDQTELMQGVARLAGKHPRDYLVDDWMVLVDWLMYRYLTPSFFRTQAEYLAVRTYIAAQIRAHENDGARATPIEAPALPSTIAGLRGIAPLDPHQAAMLDIARARAGEAITNIGEMTRHRIKQLVINHLQSRITGDRSATPKGLERQLFDEFSYLNRDWRRVAVTEAGNAANDGQIAALPPGARVKRVEAYEGACPFCRKINGMEFTVVDPSKEDKDGWKEIWPGKTNYGRSASPRKRVGDELVERDVSELWWPTAGLIHPNCRGLWVVVSKSARDPKTEDFINRLMERHGLKAPAA
jgi:hypothetical protein